MVTVCTPGKKYECVELKQIQFKMLITESGQEYLLMYDLGQQYLYAVQHGEGDQPNFVYVDNVIQIEEELPRRRIGLISFSN